MASDTLKSFSSLTDATDDSEKIARDRISEPRAVPTPLFSGETLL